VKYSFVIVFKAPVRNIMDMRLGKVIKPRAASPKAHTASILALAPMNTKII